MPVLYLTDDNISFEGREGSRVINVPSGEATQIFGEYSVRRPMLAQNLLGLYSFVRPLTPGALKVKFGALTTPRHLLQKAKGCQWSPKGRMGMNLTEYNLGVVDYDGQQCPDELAECLNALFGPGNARKDLFGTPEGMAFWDKIIDLIYTGLGNSVWDLLEFANHPLITTSDTNGWYSVSDQEWADYTDQQIHDEVAGIVTTMDQLKDVEGLSNFNVPIQAVDVDGADFVGDVIGLFNKLVDYSTADFQIMIDNNREGQAPIIEVSRSIFKAYKKYLTDTYQGINAGFQIFYTGEDGTRRALRNVLLWDGIPVVLNQTWSVFDRLVGVNTHRAVLNAPGNKGVGYESPVVVGQQYSGIGLQVVQRLDAPYKGQVYMTTRNALTGAIVNSDFMTMAARVEVPA